MSATTRIFRTLSCDLITVARNNTHFQKFILRSHHYGTRFKRLSYLLLRHNVILNS